MTTRVPMPPGKSWISFCKISRPSKVLEVLVKGPGKSWNFLGYDVGDGHNDAGADAKICNNWLRFYLYIRKNCWRWGFALDRILTVVCLYVWHRWHTTGFWNNASGVLESPGHFCNQVSGKPGLLAVVLATAKEETASSCITGFVTRTAGILF